MGGLFPLLVIVGACTGSSPSRTEAPDVVDESVVSAPPKVEAIEVEPFTGEGRPVEIARVIDGDSLELVADGETLEVRLIGVNAPELRSPTGDETCAGQQAKSELSSWLASGSVTMADDGVDRFGRTLAVLIVGDRSVNELMVASGWSLGLWSSDDPDLVSLMQRASAARLGWWGDACGLVDERLAVSGHQVNPPGDDREQLDEEWIELENLGDLPVGLEDWVLRDETTSNRFALPAVTIEPGSVVRFRVGSGSTTATDVYLGSDFPVWSNNGETVMLLRPDGVVAAHAFVPG